MANKDKKDNKTELASMYERKSITPCKSCRKYDSCCMMPRDGKCSAFEAGIPWSVTYEASLPTFDLIPGVKV